MTENNPTSTVLTELSSTANAAMTADQRERRATGVLTTGGIPLESVIAALNNPNEPWHADKASSNGVPVATWMHAIEITGPPATSLAQLLDHIHRAEAAVPMLKAGYRASRDPSGKLTWTSV